MLYNGVIRKQKSLQYFFLKYFLFHPEMVQTFSFLLFFLNIDIKKVFTVPHESFLCISYSNFCSLSLHHFAEYLIEKNLISLFSDQQSFFLNFWWPWHWMFSHMPDWEMVSCEIAEPKGPCPLNCGWMARVRCCFFSLVGLSTDSHGFHDSRNIMYTFL